jgi:amino acid adenylation domain-containing protein
MGRTDGTGVAIEPMAQTKVLPPSLAQRRVWFTEQLNPGTGAYNVPVTLRLRGRLAPEVLARSLSELVARHEPLRTSFPAVDGQPVQCIGALESLQLARDDLVALSATMGERAAEALAAAEARAAFDLSVAPLLRARLVRLARDDHWLLLTAHQLVVDDRSLAIIFDELGALYQAFSAGGESPLAPLKIQYGDYALWEREQMTPSALAEDRAYWQQQLAGAPPLLELPTDHPRPSRSATAGALTERRLPAGLRSDLEQFARDEGATVFMVLLAAFQLLLGRYARCDDIVVGCPITGRVRSETEPLVGCFVNTLALRTSLAGDPSFHDLLGRVRETTLTAYEHQNLRFEQLVAAIPPERHASHSPLVQVTFALERQRTDPLGLPGVSSELLPARNPRVRFDVELTVTEASDGLRLAARYRTDLFEAKTIERFLAHYHTILGSAMGAPDDPANSLPWLAGQEREELLRDYNATSAPYPGELCLHELVAAQAARTPDAVAIIHGDRQLDYRTLEKRANQLAHELRQRGVRPDSTVAICVERRPEMVIGQLAILKAGGAYVPLDPTHPAERLAFMLEDCKPALLLTQRDLAEKLASSSIPTIHVDTDVIAQPTTPPPTDTTPETLAYIIYTSGSTGRPKGVEIRHRGLTNLIAWHQRAYAVTNEDRATQIAATTFDASIWELWPYLTAGACVHLADDQVYASSEALVRWLIDNRITISFLPTPLAEVVLDEPALANTSLRYLLTGGEALRRRPPAGLPFVLVNHYGPSEATVVTTAIDVPSEADGVREPPIGRPIANVRVFVLDDSLRPVPVGVPGELLVGGVGLARGYLRRPALTAERFIPDAFSAEPGARLYRTGDLVRWRADGALEFLGRLDQQVKLRGFRIELGEIEAALLAQDPIAEAVVVLHQDDGEPRLIAYLVARDRAPSSVELREQLSVRLPSYMVPAAFVTLAALPMTANGKLDRRALPAPAPLERASQASYLPPRDQLESDLVDVWQQLLGVQPIGMEDDFFALGGSSLLATRLIARVRSMYAISLAMSGLVEHPTVAGMAACLRRTLAGERRELPLTRVTRSSLGAA